MCAVNFNLLESSDLFIDCVYQSGPTSTFDSEVLHKLLPKCGISGGFRKVFSESNPKKLAYVVLYTSMEELEWPDFLDSNTGLFRYYGDNREPGRDFLKTKQQGNLLLQSVFHDLNANNISEIPPFLIFQKTGNRRDVRFLGLAIPGTYLPNRNQELVAFWRTGKDGARFQNYEAIFTVLDADVISRIWLEKRIYEYEDSHFYAPEAWKYFIAHGRQGVKPLISKKAPVSIPDKYSQLQMDESGRMSISKIREYYSQNPYGFEACATEIVQMMDSNFTDFHLTRRSGDGGFDAYGRYEIFANRAQHHLAFNCYLEAKCYGDKNAVGVGELSRLISRLQQNDMGIMVTTSYVARKAYEEILEDNRQIMIVAATDIAAVLREKHIQPNDIPLWLDEVSQKYIRA